MVRPYPTSSFRPVGTSLKYWHACLAAHLESLEIRTVEQWPGRATIVGSAARFKAASAIDVALWEAIERHTLAVWWHLQRTATERVEHPWLDGFLSLAFPERAGFTLSVLRLEPSPGGEVAACIVCNSELAPYAVLGCGAGPNLQIAVKHAMKEAVQSWCGSEWCRSVEPPHFLAWDVEELTRRQREAGSLPTLTGNLSKGSLSSPSALLDRSGIDFRVHTQRRAGAVIALVESSDLQGRCPVRNPWSRLFEKEAVHTGLRVFTRPLW